MLHDGRSFVQFGIPKGGQADGASTPSQAVQVPPFVLQPPVRTQLEKPDVWLAMLQEFPKEPTRTMSPLGWFIVTPQCVVPCVAVPPGHEESLRAHPTSRHTMMTAAN